ncbi:MAG: phosphoglycerate dehydrogenase [Rhodospirillales bacterium]
MNAAAPTAGPKPRVLIADTLSPRALEIFKERGVAADEAVGLKPDQLKARLKDYDGLAVRSATKVTAEVLAGAPRLKVVGRAGIGVDNIDVPAATQRGVVVMNTPFGNSITTAEHTIALMFALARQLPAANASTHGGKWEKARFMGVELYGKTLGVIGCGNIGAIVAERAIGLHMRVLAYDPFLSDDRALALGVEKVTLDELLARADFITLHTPLTDQTRGIVDKKALAKTKKGVRIVNCARGGLVVEEDLKAAIQSGHVAGAALDVFSEEPARANALFGLDQVVVTPHLGAATAEAQENVAVQVAEQMADFLLTGAVSKAINMPSVTSEEAPRLKPYMKLAEQLGSFAGQISETGPTSVRLEYEGLVAGLNTKPLTAVALAGLLAPLMDSVNMVNAPLIARERKIDVSETRHDRPSDYQTLIRLTVTTERRTRTLAGTLFGGDKPRIVEIEGVRIEAELAPHMLYCRNEDRPGIVGGLGKLLGDNGVNIATFHLGRDRQGGQAVALLAIDQKLSGDLLDCVRELPHVNQVKALSF